MKYKISGKVIRGDGYGRKIGFPTVNLEIQKDEVKELPILGVYFGMALLDNKKYKAGIVIGPNCKIEAHIIGYSGDAYGKDIDLEIKKFLREYKKFKTEEELVAQIKKDISICSQV